ncbi:unnamed protein product [Oppiella nova]|uniref:Uncharacterized protein n=1 Tax=Oppiella nova TaxID=334625 RepID=A0A7R9MDW6_9ACAR|nr:unnamed protein product [Oppiella nova]CAG2175172.1 unnamed protein product [Oppiella nova]
MSSKTDLQSLIESLNHYMDNHLMEVRLSIGALGLVGAGIAFRKRLLNLSFAAMNPSLSGTFWLKLNVENKMVWFKVVDKHEDDIKCIVSLEKKALFKKSLNAELMERGLASVLPFDQSLYRNKTYKELHKNLTSSQSKAKRRNCGVWYKPTKWDAFRHLIDNSMHSIKNLRNI